MFSTGQRIKLSEWGQLVARANVPDTRFGRWALCFLFCINFLILYNFFQARWNGCFHCPIVPVNNNNAFLTQSLWRFPLEYVVEGVLFEFYCESWEAIPAADIRWILNGDELSPSEEYNITTTTQTYLYDYGGEPGDEQSEQFYTFDTFSSLFMTPLAIHNDALLLCEGYNVISPEGLADGVRLIVLGNKLLYRAIIYIGLYKLFPSSFLSGDTDRWCDPSYQKVLWRKA